MTSAPERIAKRIAHAGICSRREAERMIAQGLVKVNGVRITTPAMTVTSADKVDVAGQLLDAPEASRLWVYHKPKGLITTHSDEKGRDTVFDHLPTELPRVVSVGRLDLNSEGLLLLTNDGALARHMELPANGFARSYRVRVFGTPDTQLLSRLSKSITIKGVTYKGIEAVVDSESESNSWLTVTLREGKNREIRTIFEHFGHKVSRLIRVGYGPFILGKLGVGEVKEIPAREILKLTSSSLPKQSPANPSSSRRRP